MKKLDELQRISAINLLKKPQKVRNPTATQPRLNKLKLTRQEKDDLMAFAKREGAIAFMDGKLDTDNPYGNGTLMVRSAWLAGYLDAKGV